MPTVARVGPYRLFFFSNEAGEPPHVHVRRDQCVAKFWLEHPRIANSVGFRAHELAAIRRIVVDPLESLQEAWHDFFDDAE